MFNITPPTTFTWPQARRHYELDKWAHVPGIYVLQFGNKFYVGSSKDLRGRLRDWYRYTEAPLRWKCFATDDIRRTEQKIIKQLRRRGVTLLNKNDAVRQKLRKPRKRAAPKPLKGPHYRRFITIDGVTKPMSVWCRETGISVELALMRLSYGWSENRAVTAKKIRQ